MLTDISDHYPYFIFVNVCQKANKPPRLVKKRLDRDKAIEDMLTDMNECDISKTLNKVTYTPIPIRKIIFFMPIL